MTTASDLPLPVQAAAIPTQPHTPAAQTPAAQTPALRPPLALVPALPEAPAEEIVDFDDALRAATPRLQRYAARRLLDQHEAEEVVQEALLRAFQHRDTLRTEDDLMAWLTVVTGRLVIDRLRVRGRMTPVAELPAGSRAARDTADVVVARDEARLALDALEAMPTRQASVLWAREVEGLSYDEISERYGLSEPTVRSLLHRARRTLRREYAVRGGTLPSLGLVAFAPWLRGLRLASRLRDAARKTTGAAAVTATGLAVATIAPLWSHPAPAHVNAAPHPFIVQNVARPTTTDRVAKTVKVAAVALGSVRQSTPDPRLHTILRKLPRNCATGAVTAGCESPSTPMLYVTTPVKQVGISIGDVPVDCSTVPSTPATHCQPSDRKN
jgi:RNA polymerase sigma-70 factor (ECF subfamily)